MVDINAIAGATVSENGEFIKPGNYKFQLEKVCFITPRGGGEAFIAEFKVLESDNPFHQVGTKATFYQKMNDSAPGAIKGCCLRLMGFDGDPNQAPQNYLDGMSQALQACAQNPGIFGPALVECQGVAGTTKQGKPFTYITFKTWKPVEGWTAKETPAAPAMPQTVGASAAAPPTVQPVAAPVVPSAAAPAAAPVQAAMPGQQPWTPPGQQ